MKPIYLKLSRADAPIPLCASHFWGNPDLPNDVTFPTYIDEDGKEYQYVFICQINLADIAQFDTENRLPHSGLLLFFAKIDWYLGDFDYESIGGAICSPEDVKVLYFPECNDVFREVILVDDDDQPIAPKEMKIEFSHSIEEYGDQHALFAPPDFRPWETWDPPFEDWEILLQVDSFDGDDFNLNFMDLGVLDFLISPDDLRNHRFENVRALVLST